MEFVLGSLTTLFVIFISIKYFQKLESVSLDLKQYRFSQSAVHEMIKPLLPEDFFKPKFKKTQSYNHEEKTNLRVVILDGKAYWIKDNNIYEADMDADGINKDSARIVDTMSMNKVQLDKIVFIVDTLREGLDNDSGSAGDK